MIRCPFIQRPCADCGSLTWAAPDEAEVRCYVHDRTHQLRESRRAS